MKYYNRRDEFAAVRKLVLADAVAVAATGPVAGSTREVGDASTLRLNLLVEDFTAGTVTVTLEVSHNGTDWAEAGDLKIFSADEEFRCRPTGLDRYVRLNITDITGAAECTLTVSGEAV